MNTNFAVIVLTRLGVKPESAALAADAFATRPSASFFLEFNFFAVLVLVDLRSNKNAIFT